MLCDTRNSRVNKNRVPRIRKHLKGLVQEILAAAPQRASLRPRWAGVVQSGLEAFKPL